MKMFFTAFVLLILISCNQSENKKQEPQSKLEIKETTRQNANIPKPEISIEKIPAINFLYMEMRGSYQQHPAVIEKLKKFVASKKIKTIYCMGIYPSDPDTTRVENLVWKIGFKVPDDVQITESGEFKTTRLDGGTAFIVKSTAKFSPTHGFYGKVWLLEHGMIQTNPTRMVYRLDSPDAAQQNTMIVFPVQKRERDIPIITSSTLNDIPVSGNFLND